MTDVHESLLAIMRLKSPQRWWDIDALYSEVQLANAYNAHSVVDVGAALEALVFAERLERRSEDSGAERYKLIWTEEDEASRALLVKQQVADNPCITQAVHDALRGAHGGVLDSSALGTLLRPVKHLMGGFKLGDILSAVPGVLCLRDDESNYLAYRLAGSHSGFVNSTSGAWTTVASRSAQKREQPIADIPKPEATQAVLQVAIEKAREVAANPTFRDAVYRALATLGPNEWMNLSALGIHLRSMKQLYAGTKLADVMCRIKGVRQQRDEFNGNSRYRLSESTAAAMSASSSVTPTIAAPQLQQQQQQQQQQQNGTAGAMPSRRASVASEPRTDSSLQSSSAAGNPPLARQSATLTQSATRVAVQGASEQRTAAVSDGGAADEDFEPHPQLADAARKIIRASSVFGSGWVTVSEFELLLEDHGAGHLVGSEPLVVVLSRLRFLQGGLSASGEVHFQARGTLAGASRPRSAAPGSQTSSAASVPPPRPSHVQNTQSVDKRESLALPCGLAIQDGDGSPEL